MNQILTTKNKIYKKKYLLIFQLIISIIVIIAIIYFISLHFYNISKKEEISNQIMNNYNLSKLYTSISKNYIKNNSEDNQNGIFCVIEIPKINLSYPVFNTLNEELLKVSPCRFYGESFSTYDNICIAGHNYDNGKFFSNIYLLRKNDEIYIYYNDEKYIYLVTSNYEVDENDLSPIFNFTKNKKQLTLVTCNNFNDKRIIIVATMK